MAGAPERRLGVVDAALIVVGSIVGAGIFFVSPVVAQSASTPGEFLGAWVLGGVIALAGALSNGELGGLFPRSGGEYVYLREAYGPTLGFLSGWMSFWIAFPGSIAALAAGLGQTVTAMLGVRSRPAEIAVGAAAIVALTMVNACGLRPGKWTQNALSGAKLAAFVVLLALGSFLRGGQPVDLGSAAAHGGGPAGVAQALIPVMFAYSGWNAATYVSGEMRDPARSLGRALLLGTTICTILYLLINLTYLRAMPIEVLARSHAPARDAAAHLGGERVAAMLSPLIAVCVLSSMQASILVGPRIYQAMAQDGLFFAPLGRSHPKTHVPLVAIVLQSLIALVELVSGKFDQLVGFATFAIIGFSTLAVAGVVVLRVRRPRLERAFRVPGGPVLPLLFVGVNTWLMWNVLAGGVREAYVGLAIVALGLPAYAAFRAYGGRQEISR